jgi:Mce-associated membrane protein
MTLDFNHAKDDVQRVIDNSTGQFRDDFQSRADDFTKVVRDSKVVTKGSVTATAVQSMSADTALVLVAANSEVTNATGAQNEPRAWRLSVTVQRDGPQIKMSRVEFVP